MSQPLKMERTGVRQLVARNDRGGEIRIAAAGEPDSFSPGELLKLALAACNMLSADATLGHILGEGFAATVEADGTTHETENRYTDLDVLINVDMSAVDPATHASVIDRVRRSIEKRCTVGRTLDAGVTQDLSIQPMQTI